MKVFVAILGLTMSLGAPAFADPLAACLPNLPEVQPRAQEQFGTLRCTNGILEADAGRRQDGRVGKAAAILPFGRMANPGEVVTATADVMIPDGGPVNSIHLMDLECKDCGISGNPGLRLYLRDGRLRIDRAKIGERHAWVNDTAPQVPTGRWVRIAWTLALSAGADGWTQVMMDGAEVLTATGRTVPIGPRGQGVDGLQIGLTANSNDTAASVRFRDVRLTLSVGADR